MATTVNMPPVATGVWQEVAVGPLEDCLVTATRAGYYRYAASTPTEDNGHAIGQFENVNAVPEAGESFWFMCPADEAIVIKTERSA